MWRWLNCELDKLFPKCWRVGRFWAELVDVLAVPSSEFVGYIDGRMMWAAVVCLFDTLFGVRCWCGLCSFVVNSQLFHRCDSCS